MTTQLKPGLRLKSAVCDGQIVVVKASPGEHALTCGGAPLVPMSENPAAGAALDPGHAGGTMTGKRYVDESGRLELICTKGGQGSLALDGKPLTIKEAKPLPSSD